MRGPGKGKTNNPNGRKKGVPNKTTKEIREAYQMLIEKNLDNMTKWLQEVAAKDPDKAMRLINDLSEYILPKLARTEHTGEGGKELTATILFKDFNKDGSRDKQ